MFQKIIIYICIVHLINGQTNNNPFVFDLPPLNLQPLQLRLNPSSSSLFLIQQNQSIPIQSFPSQSPIFSHNLIQTSNPQNRQIVFQNSFQRPVQQSITPTNNPSQTRQQLLSPKAFSFLPLAFQPVSTQTLTPAQPPAAPKSTNRQPLAASQLQVLQPPPPTRAPTLQSVPKSTVNQNNIPKDSSVKNNEIPTIESVLRDMSAFYVPIQLPGNTQLFQQPFSFQTNNPTSNQIQTNKNTHFLPPVTLPALNLPTNHLFNTFAFELPNQPNFQTQNNANFVQVVTPAPAKPKPVTTQSPPTIQTQQQLPQTVAATQAPVTVKPVPKVALITKFQSTRSGVFQTVPNLFKHNSVAKSQSLSSVNDKPITSQTNNNLPKDKVFMQTFSQSNGPFQQNTVGNPIQFNNIRHRMVKPSLNTQLFNKDALQSIKKIQIQNYLKALTPLTPPTVPQTFATNKPSDLETEIGSTAKPEHNRQTISPVDQDLSDSAVDSGDDIEFGRRLTKIVPSFNSFFQQ